MVSAVIPINIHRYVKYYCQEFSKCSETALMWVFKFQKGVFKMPSIFSTYKDRAVTAKTTRLGKYNVAAIPCFPIRAQIKLQQMNKSLENGWNPENYNRVIKIAYKRKSMIKHFVIKRMISMALISRLLGISRQRVEQIIKA